MQIHTAASSTLLRITTCLLLYSVIIINNNQVSCIDSLKQGDTLNSSSQLDSPNGLFTLRFYAPQGTNYSCIALLFNYGDVSLVQIPAVWIGNRDQLIPTRSPLLTLSPTGELTITRRDGGDPLPLYTAGGGGTNITATVLDTGNLVVADANSMLWQSQDHPTDTLLSGMKLGLNNTKISSWLTPTNPASGAFTLEWDRTVGELVIRRRGVAYWRSGQLKDHYHEDLGNVKTFENFNFDPDPFNFNYNLSSGGDYFMYTVIGNVSMTPESRKVASGWRLDWTGNVSTIDDRGLIMAMASVCYGYNRGDSFESRGCQLWEQPQCRRGRNQIFARRSGMFRHANTTLAVRTYDYNSSLSLSDCREACWSWSDCDCVGYTNLLGQDYGCGYWIGKDLVWEQDNEGLMEVMYVLQSPANGKKNKYVGIVIGVVSAVVLLLTLLLAYYIMRKLKAKKEEELHQLLTLEGYTEGYELENRGAHSHHLKLFTYASILSATNKFSSNNKLGEGGFGPVYKGRTEEGQDIAVKLLSRQSGQGLIEFKNELVLISELQHVNLVKLLGFCIHKDDKMIIYDYMPNKSLDCFLFDPSKREVLDWKKRFDIIEGTAQGLLYLHKHSRLRIIHRDMKPNNILLDENMTPKISDFGLARIFKEEASEVNTNRRVGTYGYMAPEYAMQGIFSVKSDVYSFGVLVLEILSGRRNSSFHDIEGPLSIVEYAWELWREDRVLELVDPLLRESCIIEQVQKCIHIGLLCVENHAVDRPTIEDVLSMLKNEQITLPMPSKPAFITRNSVVQLVEKSSTTSSSEKSKLSANHLTLSEVQGR